MALDRQTLKEWAQQPATKVLLEQLKESKAEAMEAWASEQFIGKSLEEGALQNATALGGIRVLTDLIAQISDIDETEEGEIA